MKKTIKKLRWEVFLIILLNWIVIFLAGLIYQYLLVPYVFEEKTVPFAKFLRTVFFMGILGFFIRLLLLSAGGKAKSKRN